MLSPVDSVDVNALLDHLPERTAGRVVSNMLLEWRTRLYLMSRNRWTTAMILSTT